MTLGMRSIKAIQQEFNIYTSLVNFQVLYRSAWQSQLPKTLQLLPTVGKACGSHTPDTLTPRDGFG